MVAQCQDTEPFNAVVHSRHLISERPISRLYHCTVQLGPDAPLTTAALKIYNPSIAHSPAACDISIRMNALRQLQNAQHLGALLFPRILWVGHVELSRLGDANANTQIAFASLVEWIDGSALDRILIDSSQSNDVLRALANCLASLSNGQHILCHGDLKPANLILENGDFNHIRLVDFDTVCILPDAPPSSHTPCGTYGFAAPELVLNTLNNAVTAAADVGTSTSTAITCEKADVFSYAVIAHELLTGNWPYPFKPSPNDSQKLWHVRYRSLTHHLDGSLPEDAACLLASCLQPDPCKRISAAQLAQKAQNINWNISSTGKLCTSMTLRTPANLELSSSAPLAAEGVC